MNDPILNLKKRGEENRRDDILNLMFGTIVYADGLTPVSFDDQIVTEWSAVAMKHEWMVIGNIKNGTGAGFICCWGDIKFDVCSVQND